MNKQIEASRFMSLILRHKPETIGISLDEHGWADVEELIKGFSKKYPFTLNILEEIVRTDDKQGYVFYRSKNGVWLTNNVPVEFLEAKG